MIMQLIQFTLALLAVSPVMETDILVKSKADMRDIRGILIILFGLVAFKNSTVIAIIIATIIETYFIYREVSAE